jgi:hypothetical protein
MKTKSVLKLPWSTFQGASNGANRNRCFEETYWAIVKNTKYGFWPKCQNYTYKGLTNKVSGPALDQEKSFDSIYTLVQAFIFAFKNMIVWFLIKSMRGTSCFLMNFWWIFDEFLMNFWWCFFCLQKVERRCQ